MSNYVVKLLVNAVKTHLGTSCLIEIKNYFLFDFLLITLSVPEQETSLLVWFFLSFSSVFIYLTEISPEKKNAFRP